MISCTLSFEARVYLLLDFGFLYLKTSAKIFLIILKNFVV